VQRNKALAVDQKPVNLGLMARARSLVVVIGLLCGALVGCPGGGSTERKPAPCTKLGEQCVFEPGKLGACSYRANCEGPTCLYCQSQH
jgi:hypothetical protein